MKLWIDDTRDAPDDSWTEVRKVQPAIRLICNYWHQITDISLDHDIENRPDGETFEPVAYVIGPVAKMHFNHNWNPNIVIHSINPVGAKEMVNILLDYGIKSIHKPYVKMRI